MAVDAAPSVKAPAGRSRLGASTMTLATTYPVTAPAQQCGARHGWPAQHARGRRRLDPSIS